MSARKGVVASRKHTAERRSTCQIIREDVFAMTQADFVPVIGASIAKIYRLEHDAVDNMSMGEVKRAYAYATAHGITWPRRLMMAIVEEG